MKTTRFNLENAPLGVGGRNRDEDLPCAPHHVTDNALARLVNIDTSGKSDAFDHQQRRLLPERPSTSAGPSSSSRRKGAEKRETKDDLHFNPLAAHGTGTTFYNFPLPGSSPTLDQTTPPPPRKSSLTAPGSSKPDSMGSTATNMTLQPMEIGMALGSPSHPPTDWQTQTRFRNASESPSPDMMDDPTDRIGALPKPKASKWKMLGGIFGGKKHGGNQTAPFYQLQPEPAQKSAPLGSETVIVGEPGPKVKNSESRGRERTQSQRKPKKDNKPNIKRANTAPLQFGISDNGQGRDAPKITLDGGALVDNASHQIGNPYPGGMLDVDIPSVQMERYSIMFGSVLQKSTNTSSSLLARRQATLDKLKTVNEALLLQEHELQLKERLIMPRRATSPQPTSTPSFSLFPSTPSRLTVKDPLSSGPRKSPLQRSNTSPAALSPSRPTFAPGPGHEAHEILISPPTNLIGPSHPSHPVHPQYKGLSITSKTSKLEESKTAPTASKVSPPRQQSPRNWSPDQSQLILDSPVTIGHESETEDIYGSSLMMKTRTADTSHIYSPMKPKLAEPSWQMVIAPNEEIHSALTVPSSVTGSISSSNHSASSTSTSASSISAPSVHQSSTSAHKPVILSSPPPPKTRNRSETTSTRQRRNPSEVSNASVESAKLSIAAAVVHDEETEARLKTAADVSIARQISVSREQRRLLVPIKPKGASLIPIDTKVNSTTKKHNQNFPSPMSTAIGVSRVASPLGAMATAASEEMDREGRSRSRTASPFVDKRRERGDKIERLVEGVKPSTPTLVVVPGPEGNETMKAWGGVTAVHGSSVGLAERRRGNGNTMGEIKVGTAAKKHVAHQRRPKSEKVVVEQMSIAST